MKILIVAVTFPPNKDGVSEAASAMAAGFLERGWEVDVVTEPMPTPRPRTSKNWQGARVHEFSITGSGHPKRPFAGEVAEYRDFLATGQWDVLVLHAYAWPLKLSLKKPSCFHGQKILVSHGHNALKWDKNSKFPWGLGSVSWSIYQLVKMFFWIRSFDRVVYLSETNDLRSFIDHTIAKKSGYSGRHVIPNGVCLNEIATNPEKFRQDLQIGPEQIIFLCVANYNYIKNQAYALRSFRKATIPNSVMIFIGSEFNELSERFQVEDENTKNSNINQRVIWLEKQSQESKLNALATCDIFILSSQTEAQPIAILEAMKESKPWISTCVGCIPEMPGGICVQTETEMAAQMIQLANNPTLRRSLGQKGRLAVEKTYNRQAYIDSYCSLVEELVSPHTKL